MPNQIDISVIIPVFNAAQYIKSCLDSLLAQEKKAREIIVVDNGSTDTTLALVRRYEEIRLIEEPLPGASTARNKGAKQAKGSLLAFLDADCHAQPDWLKEAWRILRCHDSADGLVGASRGISQNLWAAFFQRSYNEFLREIQATDGRLLKIDSKNFFLKREAFWAIGGFDTSIRSCEDADLGIRLHRAGYRIFFSPSVVVSHLNPTKLSSRLRRRRDQGFFDYMILKKLPLEKAFTYYPAFSRTYSRYIFLSNPPPAKALLVLLTLMAEFGIYAIRSLLVALSFFGLSGSIYSLYHLLMAFAIFQGKLYARQVEADYISLEELSTRGKFSRRLT